jgi:hypothetical protein
MNLFYNAHCLVLALCYYSDAKVNLKRILLKKGNGMKQVIKMKTLLVLSSFLIFTLNAHANMTVIDCKANYFLNTNNFVVVLDGWNTRIEYPGVYISLKAYEEKNNVLAFISDAGESGIILLRIDLNAQKNRMIKSYDSSWEFQADKNSKFIKGSCVIR